jgi:hypothetical protein
MALNKLVLLLNLPGAVPWAHAIEQAAPGSKMQIYLQWQSLPCLATEWSSSFQFQSRDKWWLLNADHDDVAQLSVRPRCWWYLCQFPGACIIPAWPSHGRLADDTRPWNPMELNSSLATIANHHCAVQAHLERLFYPICLEGRCNLPSCGPDWCSIIQDRLWSVVEPILVCNPTILQASSGPLNPLCS